MFRIKDLREAKGINMREAAKLLNLPYTTYVGYEKGQREPSSEVLIQLANFYEVSIDYLVGRSDKPEPAKVTENRAQAAIIPFKPDDRNVLRLAGRDGSYLERTLTDDQLRALTAILDQMPDASDDL